MQPNRSRSHVGAGEGHIALSAIVLAFRNRPTITSAVASLLAQETDHRFEVILVASGGDGSAAVIRKTFPDVQVLEFPGRLLPGGARNAGVAVARGAVISFLAGDRVALPGWVAGRIGRHREGQRAVASSISLIGPATPSAWAFHYMQTSGRLRSRWPGALDLGSPAGHGLSYDRHLLDQLGKFPEDVVIGEDTAMLNRLAQRAVNVWFEPSVSDGQPGIAEFSSFIADQYRRGRLQGRWWLIAPNARDHPWTPPRATTVMRNRLRWLLIQADRHGTQQDRARVRALLPWLIAGVAAREAGARTADKSA